MSRVRVSTGSSPLTRGKPHVLEGIMFPTRLIPAHAGKTKAARLCAKNGRGSSPLTRGKPHASVVSGSALAAHPRSRGENHMHKPPFLL